MLSRAKTFDITFMVDTQMLPALMMLFSYITCIELGVERVGVPLAESSYFATFADSSCCVALSASVLALSAKKIQKVTIKFALFQQVQLF